MYRIISEPSKRLYPRTMDQHFRLRRRIFVGENGWFQFDVDGKYEKDAYDTPDSIYAVAIGPNEDVIGGFRLYPSMLPHMISETFAHLIDGSLIHRPDVMELSRFHLAPEYRNSKADYLEAFAAMQEIALELGLSAYTCVTKTARLHMFNMVGVAAEPLGMPADIEGESSTAVLIRVSDDCLAAINRNRGDLTSVLEHNQPRQRRA